MCVLDQTSQNRANNQSQLLILMSVPNYLELIKNSSIYFPNIFIQVISFGPFNYRLSLCTYTVYDFKLKYSISV